MPDKNTLLIELLTEELPPKALKALSDAFASKVFLDLQKANFLADQAAVTPLATPRRLAMLVTNVQRRSPDSEREVQGPSTGAPQQAVAQAYYESRERLGFPMLKKTKEQ